MSGREWKPGDVATRNGLRFMFCRSTAGREFWVDSEGDDRGISPLGIPAGRPLRPLVVLDPDDSDDTDRITSPDLRIRFEAVLRRGIDDREWVLIGERIADMLRSLIEPPKPEEPQGLGRLMSVAMTTDAVIERRKTVTRRKGWWLDKNGRRLLVPGDRLTLVRKSMGRKKGEPLVRLAEVEVVDVRRESLELLAYARADKPAEWAYAWDEVAKEGFPLMGPALFVNQFFTEAQGLQPEDDVTRIEWRYLDGDGDE